MIIDSHAHYAHNSYSGEFSWLSLNDGEYALSRGNREEMLKELNDAGIRCFIEPGIRLESNPEILAFCRAHPDRFFPAVGVHPTRTHQARWQDRRLLDGWAEAPEVVAIGELGLDFHHPRKEQHRLNQYAWFLYQLRLAKKRGLPLVLHIRDADREAIAILKRYRGNGGVVHCFNRGWDEAREYVALGYHIGIGGSLLQPEERAAPLWDAVARIPLERILVETDAPYVLPWCKDAIRPKQLRRTRNSSAILPKVVEKIAQLKNISPEAVAWQTGKNAVELFSLPVAWEETQHEDMA